MEGNILFFLDEVVALNKEVQNNIGEHLVLFCNYDPTLPEVFSEDAKFIKAVENLYKILVDSNIIQIINNVSKAGEFDFNTGQLKNYQYYSGILRTVVSHNPVDMTGKSEDIKNYKKWLEKCIGKDEINDESDYEKPVLELENIANDIVKILKRFIAQSSSKIDKGPLIAAWEKTLINFYCKPANKKIFRQEIGNYYAAIHYTNLNSSIKIREIAQWIRDSYCIKPQLETLDALKTIQELIDGDKNQEEEISMAIVKAENELANRKNEIAGKLNCTVEELDEKVTYYYDYYFSELNTKIEDVLPTIKKNKETMMPCEIMQEIFKKDFQD